MKSNYAQMRPKKYLKNFTCLIGQDMINCQLSLDYTCRERLSNDMGEASVQKVQVHEKGPALSFCFPYGNSKNHEVGVLS